MLQRYGFPTYGHNDIACYQYDATHGSNYCHVFEPLYIGVDGQLLVFAARHFEHFDSTQIDVCNVRLHSATSTHIKDKII